MYKYCIKHIIYTVKRAALSNQERRYHRIEGISNSAACGKKFNGHAKLFRQAHLLQGRNAVVAGDNGVDTRLLRLLNQRGREINTVARAFNSGYGTAEGLQQALDCLKDIAQAAYETRKEGFTHAP